MIGRNRAENARARAGTRWRRKTNTRAPRGGHRAPPPSAAGPATPWHDPPPQAAGQGERRGRGTQRQESASNEERGAQARAPQRRAEHDRPRVAHPVCPARQSSMVIVVVTVIVWLLVDDCCGGVSVITVSGTAAVISCSMPSRSDLRPDCVSMSTCAVVSLIVYGCAMLSPHVNAYIVDFWGVYGAYTPHDSYLIVILTVDY